MAPHQKRVMEELEELEIKAEKLGNFISSDAFCGIDPAEKSRLNRQFLIIEMYIQCLRERIESFCTP